MLVVVPSLLWPKEEQIAVLANTQSTLPIIRYRRRGGRIWASYERRGGNKVRGRAACLLDYTSVGLCCFKVWPKFTYLAYTPSDRRVCDGAFFSVTSSAGEFRNGSKSARGDTAFFVGLLIVERGLLLPRDDKVRRRFHDHKGSQNSNAALSAIIAPYYR